MGRRERVEVGARGALPGPLPISLPAPSVVRGPLRSEKREKEESELFQVSEPHKERQAERWSALGLLPLQDQTREALIYDSK